MPEMGVLFPYKWLPGSESHETPIWCYIQIGFVYIFLGNGYSL
jgi:hypothetical protein